MLDLNDNCISVLNIINNNGYKAYVVGGYIRDYYLNKKQSDIDITTNATLAEIKEIFKDYHIVSYKKGRTLGLIFNHEYFEISTFDGDSLEEDLYKRDFTINSIAYSIEDGIIDPYNGKEDILNGVIKCSRKPLEVINDDPLRLIRAIRFSSQYNFKIDESLDNVLLNNYDLILKISKQRITKELDKILISNKPSFYIRKYHNLFFTLIPKLKDCYKFNQNTRWHHLDVFEHIMVVLDNVPNILEVRMAALFHDIMKPACYTHDERGGHFPFHYEKSAEYCKELLKDYHYSAKFINDVYRLVLFHDRQLSNKKKSLKKLIYDFGTYNIDFLFDIKIADVIGQNPELISRVDEIKKIHEIVREIIDNNELIYLKDLAIKPKNIKALGINDDMISVILNDVLVNVRNEQLSNNYIDIKLFIFNKYIGENEI